ncbi:MAG: 1,2-phenylacetyl-CoA epoxidase subunit PaaD [Anaerolineales bacterium]
MTESEIWRALHDVKDPEIPVVSVVEMGIVRAVTVEGARVIVAMTPTFAGCPALHVIRDEIAQHVRALGAGEVEVKTVLYPPWTSDWITDEARAKLKAFGLSPPVKHSGDINLILYDHAACPRCGSDNTSLKNSFGSTLCRTIYTCNDCKETFEQFKAL